MTDQVEPAAPPAPAADAPASITLRLEDVPERTPHPVSLGRRTMLLFRFGERVYATAARCTHQGTELADGELAGVLMRCPWHGARFDVRTGARVSPPDCRDLRTFRADVRGDEVTVYDTISLLAARATR